jgi:hypothetical protein
LKYKDIFCGWTCLKICFSYLDSFTRFPCLPRLESTEHTMVLLAAWRLGTDAWKFAVTYYLITTYYVGGLVSVICDLSCSSWHFVRPHLGGSDVLYISFTVIKVICIFGSVLWAGYRATNFRALSRSIQFHRDSNWCSECTDWALTHTIIKTENRAQ